MLRGQLAAFSFLAVAAFPRIPDGVLAPCADKHHTCRSWAADGQCDENAGFMKLQCPVSCRSCGWDVGDMAPAEVRADAHDAEVLMRSGVSGSCSSEVQPRLRWQLNRSLAEQISCHNRRGAEPSGLWASTPLLQQLEDIPRHETVAFYDSVSGKPLFRAPRGRTVQEFINESRAHGWLSFRDDELVREHVRVLHNGEVVSLSGVRISATCCPTDRTGTALTRCLSRVCGAQASTGASLRGGCQGSMDSWGATTLCVCLLGAQTLGELDLTK